MANDPGEDLIQTQPVEVAPFIQLVDPETQERQFNELKAFHLSAYGPGSTLVERSQHSRNRENRYAGRFFEMARYMMTPARKRSISQAGLDPDELLIGTYMRFHGISTKLGGDVTNFDRIHSFEDTNDRKGFVAFLNFLSRTMESIIIDKVRRKKRDPLEGEIQSDDDESGKAEKNITAQPRVDSNSDKRWRDPNLSENNDGATTLDEFLSETDVVVKREKAKALCSIDIVDWKLVEPLRGFAEAIARDFIVKSRIRLDRPERRVLIAYAKTPSEFRVHGWNKRYAEDPEAAMTNSEVSYVLVEKTGFGLKLENQLEGIPGEPRDWISKSIAKLPLSLNSEIRSLQENLVHEHVIATATTLIERGALDGVEE